MMDQNRVEAIAQAFNVFMESGSVAELRGLHFVNGKRVQSIFVSSNDLLPGINQALQWESEGARGIYFTPNPVRPDLLGSRTNSKKADIIRRHWLLIDVDPKRPPDAKDQASTEAERAEAWQVISACRGTLESHDTGLQGAVVGDSGNGFHLCYPIDLPNDDASQLLLKSILQVLASLCDMSGAAVDSVVFDASRIWKLYGTITRKGEHSPERPHRLSQLVEGNPWAAEVARLNSNRLPEILQRLQFVVDKRRGRPETTQETYAAAAMKLELEAVSQCTSGRNNRLNEAGLKLGQFVGAGVLQRSVVEQALYQAACRSGLDKDSNCGVGGINATIRSSLEAGIKKPRDMSAVSATNGHTNGHVNGQAAPAKPESWKPPTPLTALPPAEPFPRVFPEVLESFIDEISWATNTPRDYSATPLLSVASGAIGNSRRLAIDDTQYQSAAIFAVIVGRPGTGKSRPLELIQEPLEKAEHANYEMWREAIKNWESSDDETRGPKPSLKRCWIDDTTTEAMVRILGENPRGLIMVRDELSALITSCDQYKAGGKGSDRQNYLKMWSGSSIKVDRKNLEGIPISVRRPFLSIVGGIQPSIVSSLRGTQGDDGFLDRFLISYPDVLPARGADRRSLTQDAKEHWEATVQTLLDLQMGLEEQAYRPRMVHLTTDGWDVWKELTWKHAAQVNATDFPDGLHGPYAKLCPGYVGRLSLVIHCLRWACGDVTGENVDGESVRRAFILVDYYKAHYRRLYSSMGADPRTQEASKVLAWIARTRPAGTFSRREVYHDLRHGFSTPEAVEKPLELLSEHGYIRPLPEPLKTIGRKPTPKYEVNPLLQAELADQKDQKDQKPESADALPVF